MIRPRCVAFVAASSEGARTGNERTTMRLATALRRVGVRVEIVRPDEGDLGGAHALAQLRALDPAPDVIHAFHARRTGPRAARLATQLGIPLVVGVTGTDLAVDVFLSDRAPIVLAALAKARAVTCGNADEVATISRLLSLPPPTVVLPKGVGIPDVLPDPALPQVAGETLVLQVAHVRPVKNVALAVRAVRRLREEGLAIRLVVLGDVLDTEYAAEVARVAGGDDAWAGILHPSVASDAMGAYYAAADVVLNTSHGEGGSNAILEAMVYERAVLASSVAGNIAYVGTHETRGLLYDVQIQDDGTVVHDEESLIGALRRLHESPSLRNLLGDSARRWVGAQHSGAAETEALLEAYAQALASD